jgi:hypothetical protein
MILDLNKKFQITFLGRKKSETGRGPKQIMTAISFGNDAMDAVADVNRRFDVWLVKNIAIVP